MQNISEDEPRNTESKKILDHVSDHVNNKIKDQDFMQRVYMVLIVPLELYRVAVSSLLIVFVPQSCNGGELCTMKENMESASLNYIAGLWVNFFTFFVFLTMYFFEIRREHMLIEYLEVNPETVNHAAVVETNLVHLEDRKKQKILGVIQNYKRIGAFAIAMYIVNAVISGVIISRYILGNQTVLAFVTNVLFMVLKFSDVYWTIIAEPNVFLSAYLKTKFQYNDVDPEHRRLSFNTKV